MNAVRVICMVAAMSLFCASCATQQESWTPSFSHEEALSILDSVCDSAEPPHLLAIETDLNRTDPIGATFERVESLRGLAPLGESSESSNRYELRAAVGFGCVYPQTFLRLIVDDERVSGDLFAWWPSSMDEEPGAHDIPSMAQIMAEENCKEARADTEIITCRYCFDPGFDWNRVLSYLNQHDVWELPDESELPEMGGFVMDGVSIEVELVSGGAFRTYSYDNPDHRSEPEAKAANAILRFIENMRPELLESE